MKAEAQINFESAGPTAFIGSSKEGLPIANKLKKQLALTINCTVWSKGVFGVGMGTLDSLVRATKKNDFAILLLTPDDFARKRGKRIIIPRDNVIFELGLFMGALGKDRTFIVHPADQKVQIPNDLAGITTATFSTNPRKLSDEIKSVCAELTEAMTRTSERIDHLTGEWHSSYQSHNQRNLGQWIEGTTRVCSKPPGRVIFRNVQDHNSSCYEAIGEFRSEREMVGVWRETRIAAYASGTFQLFMEPFGHLLYGICTGPSSKSELIYSGWILAREQARLEEAKQELLNAMCVGRLPQG